MINSTIDGNWALLLTSFLLVLYIAQGGIVLSSIIHLSHMAGAKWRADITPYAHQTVHLYPLAFVLLVILLAAKNYTFPYYLDDTIHLNGWHNYPFLVIRELVLFLLVAASNYGFVRASKQHEKENTEKTRNRLTWYATAVPFLYFIYGTMVAWDFEMTLTPGWHSPMYAPYFFVSNFHMFLGFFVVVAYLPRFRKNGRTGISEQSFNYLAQMMLGLTLLWTYTFYAQFLTIWYGNLPHETARLYAMMFIDGDIRLGSSALAPMFWWFIILKSFLPFSLLIFATVRHTPFLTALVGLIIFAGTFLEHFTWIAGAYSDWQPLLGSSFDIAVISLVTVLGYLLMRAGFVSKDASNEWSLILLFRRRDK
jgi:hypothetical protein